MFGQNKEFAKSLIDKYHPAQITSEFLHLLLWLNNRRIDSILEIGVHVGGSLRCFLDMFPASRVTGIEIDSNLRRAPLCAELEGLSRCNLIFADSHLPETVQLIAGNSYDLIFVDGDHTKDGVAQDFDLYFPLLSDAGVFAFHDIKDTNQHRSQGCYVFEVWNKLKSKYFSIQFLDNTQGNANWGGIGVLLKHPLGG